MSRWLPATAIKEGAGASVKSSLRQLSASDGRPHDKRGIAEAIAELMEENDVKKQSISSDEKKKKHMTKSAERVALFD